MRIGFTYDLRADYLALGWSEIDSAEFDSQGTIDAVTSALTELGHEVVRIGRGRELARRLVEGERWDLVFNICEGTTGRGREALVPALLECYGVPYTFCDPLTACVTLDKAAAKRIIRDGGLPTPDFHVVESAADVDAVEMAFPLFAKPLAEGTGKGVDVHSVIRDRAALRDVCARLLDRFRQPVLVEEFLPGREVTVGVLGTGAEARVIGVLDVRLLDNAESEVYSYTNKEFCEDRVAYRLVEPGPFSDEAGSLAVACHRALGCRDVSRIDLRADRAGRLSFIEANPLPGINPGHSDLPILNRLAGGTYLELIGAILESAMKRVRGKECGVRENNRPT
jgi:D-alanine-D-alanine ligase